jgi:hypothetical protein
MAPKTITLKIGHVVFVRRWQSPVKGAAVKFGSLEPGLNEVRQSRVTSRRYDETWGFVVLNAPA